MKIKTQIRIKYFSKLLFTLFLCHSSLIVAAEDELFFDMPVVLSANRLEQPAKNAAVSISIIDREMIEASGARTIPEVLRLVPGMQVGYSGNEFGTEPKYAVTYHGQSGQYSKQIQVLIDGRSIYNPFFGGILWKAIPVNIDDIERIEVSRGPNPATYGSNSFQAAINIITRSAAEDQGSYLRTNVGNHDIKDMTYRYGGSDGKLDYRVTLSTLNDNGLDSANQYDYPDDTHSDNIDYRLDYQLDNNNTLSYQGGFGINSQDTDTNHDDVQPTSRTVENTRFFQFIKWENAISKENTLQLQYFYNLNDKSDLYHTEPLVDLAADISAGISSLIGSSVIIDPFALYVDADIKSERHNLELTQVIYPVENLKLSWGVSAQIDYVQAPFYFFTNDKINHEQYRTFADVEWQLSKSDTINIGGLLEKNNFTETTLSPRLSFIHAFNQQHKVRLGISQAHRNPFAVDARGRQTFLIPLYSGGNPTGYTLIKNVFTGNEDLKNEKITSQEIAYLGEFFNSSILFNARLFHDKVSNFIDTVKEVDDPSTYPDITPSIILPLDSTVYVFNNTHTNSTAGLELELDYRIDSTLRLIASGAIINISSDFKAMALSAPQHSYSFLLSKQFNEKYSGSLAYYFVEAFSWTDVRGGTDDYRIMDMRLSRNFHFNKTNGSLSVVIKNMLDDYSDYQENPSSPTAPKVINNTLAYVDFRLNF